MKIRLVYSKLAEAKYVAHLDLTRFFTRALRRAGVDVARSQGFNPRPRISFGPPLAVGAEGLTEYADVEINGEPRRTELEAAMRALRCEMPRNIPILDYKALPPGAPALTAVIDLACYLVWVPLNAPAAEADLHTGLNEWLRQPEVIITKNKGEGAAPVKKNIRPFVRRLALRRTANAGDAVFPPPAAPGFVLELEIGMSNAGSAKAADVIDSVCEFLALPWDKRGVAITRTALFTRGEKRCSPLEV
ncbi:MAG: TIGR03936 family radical SAM-associated protein [Gracilibacteraceae bacterium]|jgi:radical SAM-linked protein|nr:TIGR03936 family radical SAM-associated protein [Gracilibacteraceae bacterium]